MITLALLTKGGSAAPQDAGPYDRIGPQEGPGEPVMPRCIAPEDFGRGYLAEGRAASSPGQDAPCSFPVIPGGRHHVDLTGARATVQWAAHVPGGER